MNTLYCRLAMTNLKNNRQFYLPYILVGVVSAMMFYIMRAIQGNKGIDAMRGYGTLKIVLFLGVIIVGLCTCIFLFYTNSFVMKRRKKELGVYNILGMEKKHIAKVMAWEAVILYGVSVGGGLVFGILFHKLVAMFLYHLTGLAESIPFSVSGWGCLQTIELFGILYLVMLCYNFFQVKLANPIALLHGTYAGEREPKANWLFAGLGVGCIVTGYYLALTVYGVIEAVNMFFVAVLLVIAGTYALFISVSIVVLKLLKKNKKYYYQTAHFITVSGMIYRMKRNATGLANICILSTMVLVMISTTVCLYAGTEASLQNNFPREINATLYFDSVPDDAAQEYLREQIASVAEEQGRKMTHVSYYTDAVVVTHNEANAVERYDKNASYGFSDMGMLYVMTKEDYELYVGEPIDELEQGGVLVASLTDFLWDTITIFGQNYTVEGQAVFPDDAPDGEMTDFLGSTNVLYVIVADDDALNRFCVQDQVQYHIGIETDGTQAERKAFVSAFRGMVEDCKAQLGFATGWITSRVEQQEIYLEMNGGFLFLGLFLGSMFLMITVLIIYYKQISEGFEDRERFAIMTKVGMSRDMVKSAIRTQMRMVFFLPITVAVVHLAMAFPMLKLMMQIFGLANVPLFVGCLIATAAVFAVIYFIVFRVTSGSYYRLVYR